MTFDSPQGAGGQLVQHIIKPIYEARGWMKLLAVLTIAGGVLTIIGTFGLGIVIAWLPIWVGVLLWQSANKASEARAEGMEETAVESLSKIKTIFTIYGVIALIGVAFWVAIIVFAIFAVIFGDFSFDVNSTTN